MTSHVAPDVAVDSTGAAERRLPRFWSRRQPSPPPSVELNCACGVRISAAGLVGVLAARKSIFNHTCHVEDKAQPIAAAE